MNLEAKQRSYSELKVGDFICIPGLPDLRFPIRDMHAEVDGYIIDTSAGTLNLPDIDRKVWTLTKEEVDAAIAS
jgi:hypothetical protein